MKIKNTTDWKPWFLRRMTAWCAQQIECPVRVVRLAQFRSRTIGAFSGHAYPGRFVVSIGPEQCYPCPEHRYAGAVRQELKDRIEGLVAVTAHELAHVRQYWKRLDGCEHNTKWAEDVALERFRAARDLLLAAWSVEPAVCDRAPKATVVQRRAIKAKQDLERWQRKLQLAKTKVRKLTTRVRYYERALA